jgi:hypothetical protein
MVFDMVKGINVEFRKKKEEDGTRMERLSYLTPCGLRRKKRTWISKVVCDSK